MKPFFLVFLLAFASQLNAQKPVLQRIEPLFWYSGMNNPEVQLMVYGKNIGKTAVEINHPGVKIKQAHQVENPDYLFLDLVVGKEAQPGKFTIRFKSADNNELQYAYELKPRNKGIKAQGVGTKDLIYLIMPDRFANGDTGNDVIPGLLDKEIRRDSMYYRHGGDLKGIISKLDYLQELGVTTLWLNPVLTNDMQEASYHGYAQTENYHIDPRFGGNEAYLQLSEALHRRGMKLIKDIVHNHFGLNHWTVVNPPFKNWVNQWPSYTNTNYKDQAIFDPYASDSDKSTMVNGWFVPSMPDMNQHERFVRNYITQSHIWWIEYAGIDGFRLDTYPYNDLNYMAEWAKKITDEFPDFTFFGETWVHGVPNQAAFTEGNVMKQGIDTGLQGVTDFQLHFAIIEALNGDFGWTTGVNKLYSVLASDYVYKNPAKNVIFLDNHDISRFFSVIGEDHDKYKAALSWLLTYRGIPQLYYGAEILMKNFSNPDGLVRSDFPGGWPGDTVDKFTSEGRTPAENEIVDLIKSLAAYRKKYDVLATGKLMHYVPVDGVYVYFRYDDEKTVMVIMNTSGKETTVETSRFTERIKSFSTARNLVTNQQLQDLSGIKIPARNTWVLELGN